MEYRIYDVQDMCVAWISCHQLKYDAENENLAAYTNGLQILEMYVETTAYVERINSNLPNISITMLEAY